MPTSFIIINDQLHIRASKIHRLCVPRKNTRATKLNSHLQPSPFTVWHEHEQCLCARSRDFINYGPEAFGTTADCDFLTTRSSMRMVSLESYYSAIDVDI